MPEADLFAVGLAIAVAVLLSRVLATRIQVPDSILQVLLGVGASFVPGMPVIHLSPDVVLLFFLPPLVYHAGFFSAPRETRENAIPIAALAIGLVVATALSVAGSARLVVPDLAWAAALALGAAVAPTDPIAATSVMQRLGAPMRVLTILEGESLVNDGIALTLFALAVESAGSSISVGRGVLLFFQEAFGGIAFGLAVGWVVARLRRRVHDPGLQIVVSVITPYAAYIPADRFGLSGVLASVGAGVYLGTRARGLFQPASRMSGYAFWNVLIFLLESTLFVLLGLEFREIVSGVGEYPVPQLALTTGAVVAVMVALRLAWQLAVSPLGARLPWRDREYARIPWRQRLVIGWGGIRGAVTLAIALSIPTSAQAGGFAHADLLVFVAAIVILFTLVGQAATLTPLLRALGLVQTEAGRAEELQARQSMAETALRRLEELAAGEGVDEDTAAALRQVHELRLNRLRALRASEEDEAPEEVPDTRPVRGDLVRAQRDTLRRLYRDRRISVDTLRTLNRELDLEDPRLHRH